jgi:hypothetical protein
MEVRRRGEIALVVGATWLLGYLVALLSLGLVRLRPECEICGAEQALRNLWSHMRWHLARGEWQ